MAEKPITNPGNTARYVAGRMIPPGETRLIPEHELPPHLKDGGDLDATAPDSGAGTAGFQMHQEPPPPAGEEHPAAAATTGTAAPAGAILSANEPAAKPADDAPDLHSERGAQAASGPAVQELLERTVPEIREALTQLSVDEIDDVEQLEEAAEKLRKGVLEALSEERSSARRATRRVRRAHHATRAAGTPRSGSRAGDGRRDAEA